MRPRPSSWIVLVALLLIGLPRRASADTLDEVRRSGTLVWGGDQEGGGPYIFPRADDPSQVTGFEVDLAEAIARQLGVRAVFAQGDWTKMPDLLRAHKLQLVLNGFEWSPERAAQMQASIPYYVYGLQLLARKSDASLRSWSDLGQKTPDGARRKLGVLAGSAAETHASRELGTAVELVLYDGNTDAMREVETGKLDATLQDTPIVTFYAPRFPELARIGDPVGKGYYVAFVRQGDTRLSAALDQALLALIQSGKLEQIYRRYGLWDERQAELVTLAEHAKFFGAKHTAASKSGASSEPPAALDSFQPARGLRVVTQYGGILLQSAGMTVILALLSFPLALMVGLLVAVGRRYGPRWLRAPLTLYVEFLRGTPLMLQLYFLFFFLPELGIRIPAFTTAILGLAINYSAYEAEIYRAGLQAVPPGQMEAAVSLGMSRPMALRRIIVPQAVEIVIPPVVNDFIALFKDTSICSVVTIVELTKRYSVLSMSTGATFELMLMTAALYLIMSYPLSIASRKLERLLAPEAA